MSALPSAGWVDCELSGTTVHDRHLREGEGRRRGLREIDEEARKRKKGVKNERK